jgi:hypothetical protein
MIEAELGETGSHETSVVQALGAEKTPLPSGPHAPPPPSPPEEDPPLDDPPLDDPPLDDAPPSRTPPPSACGASEPDEELPQAATTRDARTTTGVRELMTRS